MRSPVDARGYRNTFTPQERFWAKVQGGDVDTCWIWSASLKVRTGYGAFRIGERIHSTHKLAYEWMVGPVPEGLELDHLCRHRACVNPWHLEPVTPLVNSRRGARCRATTTECANGHSWAKETTVFYGGYRKCLTCSRDRSRTWRAQSLEVAA